MQQFHGYRIKSTNIETVEKTLRAAKENLAEAAKEAYHRFLGEEVAELVDDITLGIRQRPGISILDAAIQQLNQRVSTAENLSTMTEYDLRSGVTIIPDKGYTYLLFTAANPTLEKAFADAQGIEDYTVGLGPNAENTEEGSARAKKWERLCKRTTDNPALLTATLTSKINVDPSILVFPDKEMRAGIRARRNLTSRYLNQYACGQEIKREQLMPLLDKALERILSDDASEQLRQMTERLSNILIDITPELIMKDPSSPAEQASST